MTNSLGFLCVASDNNSVTLQREYSGKGSVKKRRQYQKQMPKLVVRCVSEEEYQEMREAADKRMHDNHKRRMQLKIRGSQIILNAIKRSIKK